MSTCFLFVALMSLSATGVARSDEFAVQLAGGLLPIEIAEGDSILPDENLIRQR